jgi:protein TonB
MFIPSSAGIPPTAVPSWQQLKSLPRLGLIVLAHIGLLYALKNGLHNEAGQVAPVATKEIVASFIATENVPQPKQQVQPKPQVMMKLDPVRRLVEPVQPPVAQQAPQEKAITTPAETAQSSVQPQPATAAKQAAPATSEQQAASVHPETLTTRVEYIQAPQPEYPPMSQRLRERGIVEFRVLVNEKGRAERMEVKKSSGYTRLDEAGRQALMRALFKPHTKDGRPVPAYVFASIEF